MRPPCTVSPYVLVEVDCLAATRHGVEAELVVLNELRSGARDLPAFGGSDLRRGHGVIERYQDQDFSLADASLLVLAARDKTNRRLSFDYRHFEVVLGWKTLQAATRLQPLIGWEEGGPDAAMVC